MGMSWQPNWGNTVDWGAGLGDITCPSGYAPDPSGSVCVVSQGLGCDPTTTACGQQCPNGVWTTDLSLCPSVTSSFGLPAGVTLSTSTILIGAAALLAIAALSGLGGKRRR